MTFTFIPKQLKDIIKKNILLLEEEAERQKFLWPLKVMMLGTGTAPGSHCLGQPFLTPRGEPVTSPCLPCPWVPVFLGNTQAEPRAQGANGGLGTDKGALPSPTQTQRD